MSKYSRYRMEVTNISTKCKAKYQVIFFYYFCLILGQAQKYSGLTPGSVLKKHSWHSLGTRSDARSDLDHPHLRQMPYSLY